MKYEIQVWEPHHRGVPVSLWRKIGEIMIGKQDYGWKWVNDPKLTQAANLQKELNENMLIGTAPTVGLFWEDDVYTFTGFVPPHPFAGANYVWIDHTWTGNALVGAAAEYPANIPFYPAYPL